MPVAIAVAGLVVAAAGTTASVVAGNQARSQARHAADLQQQSTDVTMAQNAQQAAEAQRQQLRDERVKQARVMQGATNSGADLSSGELGAVGALSTNLSSNQEQSIGAVDKANQISSLNQEAANSMFESRQTSQMGAEFAQFGQLGGSIFGAAAKTPTVARSINSIFS